MKLHSITYVSVDSFDIPVCNFFLQSAYKELGILGISTSQATYVFLFLIGKLATAMIYLVWRKTGVLDILTLIRVYVKLNVKKLSMKKSHFCV
jgi:hypothetical protein